MRSGQISRAHLGEQQRRSRYHRVDRHVGGARARAAALLLLTEGSGGRWRGRREPPVNGSDGGGGGRAGAEQSGHAGDERCGCIRREHNFARVKRT